MEIGRWVIQWTIRTWRLALGNEVEELGKWPQLTLQCGATGEHQIWIIFSELERLDLVPKTRFREPSLRWYFIRAMNILSCRYPPVIKHGNAKKHFKKKTLFIDEVHIKTSIYREKSYESIVKIG